MKNSLYIIAEISANHNNDLELTYRTIDAIADSGANAVKVQTYTADSLTLNLNTGYFSPKTEGLWKGQNAYEVFSRGALPYDWHRPLKEYTEAKGLEFFSSPFDKEGVDLLASLNVPRYKIASFEITDIPLIEYTASQGKPLIMSTGVAAIEDIELALAACRRVGNNDVTLLKCTSEYPATADVANLFTIPDMRARFGVAVGLSDHTMGATVPVVAVALGARIIEKHFILDRGMGGVDSAFSMEPHEFKQMVDACHDALSSLGGIQYELTERNKNRRRSIFVSQDIKKGEELTMLNIKSVRPGMGLHPQYFNMALGSKATRDLSAGEPLSWSCFDSQHSKTDEHN